MGTQDRLRKKVIQLDGDVEAMCDDIRDLYDDLGLLEANVRDDRTCLRSIVRRFDRKLKELEKKIRHLERRREK